MTTATARAEKLLIYDGDCPMCRGTVALLLRWKLIRPEQARANYDLNDADLKTAEAAGVRNELVVLDPQTRQTRRGTDALLWIARDNLGNPPLLRALGLPGFRHALRWAYQIISYNRRILSPPGHQIVCDCEPEVTLARRLSLIVPATLLALPFIFGFGASVFDAGGLGSATDGGWLATGAFGAGYTLLIAGALVWLRGQRRIDYIAHLAVTLLAGAFVLVPAAVLVALLPPRAALPAAALGIAVSIALMLAMQRRRMIAMKLSRGWLAAWPIAILLSAIATVSAYRAW